MSKPSSPPLFVAGLLSVLAGAVDGVGYLLLGRLFVSFMSGNSTILAVAAAQGHWHDAARAAGIVLSFVMGVALGTVVGRVSRPYSMPAVLALVSALLFLAAAWPGAELAAVPVAAMAAAMGAVNTATDTAGGVPVSLTFVTGALVRLGRGLGAALYGDRADRSWLAQLALWGGLVMGAGLGAVGEMWVGRDTLWAAAAGAAIMAVLTASVPRLRGAA